MKQKIFGFWVAVFALMFSVTAIAVDKNDKLKPFVLASKGPGDFNTVIEDTKASLEDAGFNVIGEYEPYADTHVIVTTNRKLQGLKSDDSDYEDLGKFAAIQRVSVVNFNDEIQVSFANPVYVAQAYQLTEDLEDVRGQLEEALGYVEDFGAEGMKVRKLRKYNYTWGMEHFDDVYELGEYSSYSEAVRAVEKNLESNNVVVRKVYRLDIPGKEITLFGVSRKAEEGSSGDKYMDDKFIMGTVDFEPLKMAAYLPYEIMVKGDEVIALHMRFRMAVHRPDLKMMGDNSFMELMPSPAAIEKALREAATGETD